jgi:hypothetical protein
VTTHRNVDHDLGLVLLALDHRVPLVAIAGIGKVGTSTGQPSASEMNAIASHRARNEAGSRHRAAPRDRSHAAVCRAQHDSFNRPTACSRSLCHASIDRRETTGSRAVDVRVMRTGHAEPSAARSRCRRRHRIDRNATPRKRQAWSRRSLRCSTWRRAVGADASRPSPATIWLVVTGPTQPALSPHSAVDAGGWSRRSP